MHARHRNGYRSNRMDMGGNMLAPSRISPESSMRTHRVYSSEYRNNNRGGYGRGGHSRKQFQPPPAPPRRADIFAEAGKLAAEYLVSKGVIPPNALSGKWRSDEYNLTGMRRKNYESEMNRELGKSGSWAESESGFGKNAAHLESGMKKCDLMEEAGVKASSSSNEKNVTSDADGETVKTCDDANEFHADTVIKVGKNDNDLELKEDEVKEGSLVHEENVDLLKNCKFEQDPKNECENLPDRELSGIHVIDVAKNDSLPVNVSSNQNPDFEKSLESDVLCAPTVEKEQESDQGQLSGFGSSSSIFIDRGVKKRAMDEDDRDDFKKLREWVPPMENQSTLQEKHLFPGSFKSFDLNLNGTCDVNENHDGKEVTRPIDVDLPVSKISNLPNRNDIEIIDLENDSAQEDKTFGNLERREDSVFTDLDGFSNNVHNAIEIPEVQDGYGLMLSELLGNDNPNCSSVPTDLNSLHDDIGLPNGEGILGDDDSIYMSLEEIPIGFLRAWEQPPQDYGKPF